MRIAAVEAIPIEVPKTRPFSSALGTFTAAQSGILRVQTDDGIEGIGEIDILWHGGGAALCEDVNRRIGPALAGADPMQIVQVHTRLGTLCQFGYHTNVVRAAVDMALYDIAGKTLGVPVYVLLGGKARERIDLSMSIHMAGYEEMIAQARAFVENGFRTVKVKVGVDPDADVKIVRGIRQTFGDTLNIRVDANMGWQTAKEALEMIRRLNEYRILSVEQPLPPERLEALAYVREHAGVPVMVDESVWSPVDAWRVVRAGAADILNVYVVESGGIYPSLKIFHLAELAGVECTIGSMPEFGFGTAAQAHLGVAVPVLRHPADVAGVLYQGDDLICRPLRIEGGFAYPPEGPGLGVEPDWEKIEFYRVSPGGGRRAT
jgi:L-alanine-DL-glutamate epimerase-like enolase superfamily enzyme